MHKEHRVATEKMAMTSLLIQEGSWKLWPLERTLATMDATRAPAAYAQRTQSC